MEKKNDFDYSVALDFIYSRRKYAKSSSLERMDALLNALGRPQDELRFVHIVGTNGKGSTAHMVSRCLAAAGHTVGLFTSPFVVDFTERIQINNCFVDKAVFSSEAEKVKSAANKLDESDLSPTFFETVLATALLCFKAENCDIVVLEAGIGGKHDSTNIIPAPLVAAFTSISIDHTEMLGETVREIAREKCGIIKEGSTVISFPETCGKLNFAPQSAEAMNEIRGFCADLSSLLVVPDMNEVRNFAEDEDGIRFLYKGSNIHIPLHGEHQAANAAVALEILFALRRAGVSISDEAIKAGMSRAFVPGRMETFRLKGKTVVLDGGHNPGCMLALKATVERQHPGKSVAAVLGFMKDKDWKSSVKIIAPLCDEIVFTLADSVRGERPEILADAALSFGAKTGVESDPLRAFDLALKTRADVILCAGSFYLVSEIRKSLTNSL